MARIVGKSGAWPAAVALTLVFLGCTGIDDDDSSSGDDDTGLDGPGVSNIEVNLHDEFESLVVVTWEQIEAGTVYVAYRFGDETYTSPQAVRSAGDHEQVLLGIPYETDVELELVVDRGEGPESSDSLAITTDDIPALVPPATVFVADAERYDPEARYFLVSINEGLEGHPYRYWALILDRAGRLVWAMETPSQRVTIHTQTSHDGRQILIDHNSFWGIFDGGEASQIARLHIDGSGLEIIDVPGLHHPFTEIGDGSLVWGAVDGDDETIEKLGPGGAQQTVWSCQEYQLSVGVDHFCASNTLTWREATDTFLFSFYSSNAVIDIDHATGQTLRSYGQLPGSWSFDPPDSTFWWQHGVHYTDEGTLLVSARIAEDGHETVAREYQLDEEGMALVEIWNYGIGEGIHATEMGEAQRLANGNILHNYGNASVIKEVMPDGTVVWELEWVGDYLALGRSTPLSDLYSLLP